MKKRKELDALLTNMANGKKNGKSKRAKDGHELLRLDSDSNSSDNDELFLAPKKTVIRRPQQCGCCSMCVPLIMFILTVGCIVITGGLIWMHFNLKQDLDDLRVQFEKVTAQMETSRSQSSTIMDLESRLQAMNDVPGKVDIAGNNIAALNTSFIGHVTDLTSRLAVLEGLPGRVETLEKKVPSSTGTSLSQTVADNGSKINALDQKVVEEHASMTQSLQKIKDDIINLQSQVAELQLTARSPPTTLNPPLQPPASSTTEKSGSSSGDAAQFNIVEKDIQTVLQAVSDINATVRGLQREQDALAKSVSGLQESIQNHTSLPAPTMPKPIPDLTTTATLTQAPQPVEQYDLAKIQADIELLKIECNTSTEFMPSTSLPQAAEILNVTWLQVLSGRVDGLEHRVEELNPKDLNNNLLNANTTQSMQMLFERSLENFKAENLADYSTLEDKVTGLVTDVQILQTFQDEIGVQMESLGNEVKSLQQDCAVCRGAEPAGPAENPSPFFPSTPPNKSPNNNDPTMTIQTELNPTTEHARPSSPEQKTTTESPPKERMKLL